jgi:tyrosinase
MGYVPTAAQDPIFWMHHCNIDRLWASWNRAGNANPTDPAFLNQKFSFAGKNGAAVQMAVGDVMDIDKLNYTYQEFQPAPDHRPIGANLHLNFLQAMSRKAPVPSAKTLASSTRFSVAAGRSKASLQPAPAVQRNKVFDLTLGAPAPGVGRYYLVIKDLEMNAQPGGVYQLYLDLPDGAAATTRDAHFVGFLNFFAAMPGMSMDSPDRFRSYDISALVSRLGAAVVNGPVNLTVIAPDGATASAAAMIGSVSIVQI